MNSITSRSYRLITLLAVVSAFAISQNAMSQTARMRDSAGIRIVENPPRRTSPIAFTLSAKPNFDVGGVESDPEVELGARNPYPRAIRLSDGKVVVTDRTRIQFFDQTGKRLKIFGREGGGPKEFRSTSAVCRTRGDTVLVSDDGLRRITVLDKAGNYLSEFPITGGAYAERAFCFDDGTFLASMFTLEQRSAPRTLQLTRFGLDGKLNSKITDVNIGLFDMAVYRESSKVASGQKVYFGNALNFEVAVYGVDGKLQSLIRTSDKLDPISKSELEKMPQTGVRANATAEENKARAQQMAAKSTTKYWPAYDRVMVDMAGRIWIEDWRPPTSLDENVWAAFDATGKLIGRMVIPAAESRAKQWRVVDFGKDEVFVKRLDDDGAIHFTAYSLMPKK